MYKLITLLVLLSPFFALSQVKTESIGKFKEKQPDNAMLIDVRTPQEYDDGHLDNALNINWLDAGFISAFDTIPKTRDIYVYCKKGGRSARAAMVLDSLGYSVTDLLGGYDALKPAGSP